MEIMFIDFVDLASHEDLNLIMGPICGLSIDVSGSDIIRGRGMVGPCLPSKASLLSSNRDCFILIIFFLKQLSSVCLVMNGE